VNEVPELVKVKQVNEFCTGCFFKWAKYQNFTCSGLQRAQCVAEKIIFKAKKPGRA
jgi:hypothetical protein